MTQFVTPCPTNGRSRSLLQDQFVPPRDPQSIALAGVFDADFARSLKEFVR
jgi:hypothetical protein